METPIEGSSYICAQCGCPTPCLLLSILHIVTAHLHGDIATSMLEDTDCRQCLLESTELFQLKELKDGSIQRVALIGKTQALVLY